MPKPDPNSDRLIFSLGYAHTSRQGRTVYEWEKIRRDLWLLAWPTASVREFCTHYGIAYKSAKNNAKWISAEEKRAFLAKATRGHMEAVVRELSVVRAADMRNDALALGRVLDQFQEIACLLAARCRSDVGKDTSSGLTPNTKMNLLNLRATARIANDAFDLLRKTLETQKSLGIGEPENQIVPVPTVKREQP